MGLVAVNDWEEVHWDYIGSTTTNPVRTTVFVKELAGVEEEWEPTATQRADLIANTGNPSAFESKATTYAGAWFTSRQNIEPVSDTAAQRTQAAWDSWRAFLATL